MKQLLLLVFTGFAGVLHASVVPKPSTSQYGFIENKGQIIDQNNQLNATVLYLYNGNGLHVQLRKGGFSYEVIKTETKPKTKSETESNLPTKFKQDSLEYTFLVHRIDISFFGANPNAKIIAYEPAADYINYYTTGTTEEGVTNVHHYKKVVYENVYPNIDVEFLVGKQFKYNFIVRPGGNVSDIKLRLEGANHTSLNSSGHVLMKTTYGDLEESIPESYQVNTQKEHSPVIASFSKLTDNLFGLVVNGHDQSKLLVIDPVPGATYYGGSANDNITGITTNTTGDIFVSGYTASSSAIATAGSYQATIGGNNDAFVARFTSTSSIQWATYYGGNGDDRAYGLARHRSGYLFLAGVAGSTGMATTGAYQDTLGGNADVLLARFSETGLRQWATYYGGGNAGMQAPGGDYAYGVATDTAGNAYVTGWTTSATGISTPGAHQTSPGFSIIAPSYTGDAFVAKFSSTAALIWGTYYGGTVDDVSWAIAADPTGNIIITGMTQSSNAIATTGSFQPAYQSARSGISCCCPTGTYDAFVTKFNAAGIRQWGTYYSDLTIGYGVTLDTYGNTFMTGSIGSASSIGGGGIGGGCYFASYPGQATTGAHQTVYGGGASDAMLVKFNSTGLRIWSTFVGGTGDDRGYSVATDVVGNIFLGGITSSVTGIATSAAYQTTNAGGTYDAFLTKFDSAGVRQWATYCGFPGAEYCTGIAVDSSGGTYLAGYSNSTTPLTWAAPHQSNNSGGHDGLITCFNQVGRVYPFIQGNIIGAPHAVCSGAAPSTLSGSTTTGGNGIYSYKWLKSTQSSTLGFTTGGGNDSSLNYSPGTVTTATWFKRVVISGNDNDTSSAVLISIKLRPGFTVNSPYQCLNGNSFLFTDTTYTDQGSVSRKWYFGTGASDTSSLATPSKSYTTAGMYTVKLIASANGCVDSISKNIYAISINPGFYINNTTQCLGGMFTFYDTSHATTGTLSRLWNFGPGDTASTQATFKIYPDTGTYFVKLISINQYGCRDSAIIPLLVISSPKAGFVSNASSQCIKGGMFQFSDTSRISMGLLTAKWTFSTSPADTLSGASVTKMYTTPGTYIVKLVASANNGCKDSITKTVNVLASPKSGFTINNASQCIGSNSFIFKDTSSFTSGSLTRIWSYGPIPFDTAKQITSSYATAGPVNIRLTSIGSNGCRDSAEKTVKVVKVTAAADINNDSQCLRSNAFSFTARSTVNFDSITWNKWTLGGGTSDTSLLLSPTKVYGATGTYPIKLVSFSTQGCKDSTTFAVVVQPHPVAGFTISKEQQCLSGNHFQFNNTSFISSGNTTPIWSFGDGNGSSVNHPSATFVGPGTYAIKLVETSNYGCTDSSQKTVTVYAQPVAGFTWSALTQCLIGNRFSFDDTSATTATRLWSLGDLTTNTNDTFSKSYATAGAFNVQLKVTNANGCSDSLTKTMTVKPNPVKPVITALSNSQLQSTTASAYQWFLGTTAISGATSSLLSITANGSYTVKGDSTNGCSNISDPFVASHVAVDEPAPIASTTSYPNPATSELFISMQPGSPDETVIEICDMKGSQISRVVQPFKDVTRVGIESLPEGMYILRVNGKAFKFVKEN